MSSQSIIDSTCRHFKYLCAAPHMCCLQPLPLHLCLMHAFDLRRESQQHALGLCAWLVRTWLFYPYACHTDSCSRRFELPAFYTEVRRILKPSGAFAAWGYDLCVFPDNEEANTVLERLYNGVLGPYWSDRRRLVEAQYKGESEGLHNTLPTSPVTWQSGQILLAAVPAAILATWRGYALRAVAGVCLPHSVWLRSWTLCRRLARHGKRATWPPHVRGL